MSDKKREVIKDPRYAPPYPQDFYPFWPRHVIKAGILISIVLTGIILLSYYFKVPTDVNMPPLPNEGAYIPAPEWYLLFLFQPFWYLTGDYTQLRPVLTFWIPILFIIFLFLIPFILGKKKKEEPVIRMTTTKKVVLAISVWLFWILIIGGIFNSGYPAKTHSCISCHNSMMGARQALPPADVAEYYRVVRQRQIEVGRYRAGKTFGGEGQLAIGGVETYKDANWQLRHFYEPTMTW